MQPVSSVQQRTVSILWHAVTYNTTKQNAVALCVHVGHWVSTKFVAEMSTDSTTSIYFGSDPENFSHKLPVEWTCLAMLRTYTHPHSTPRQKWKRPCLNMVMQNSDAELCRFLWSVPKQAVKQAITADLRRYRAHYGVTAMKNCSQMVTQNSLIFNVLVPFIISDLSWKFHKIWSHIFFVILHKARETNQQLIRLHMPVGK